MYIIFTGFTVGAAILSACFIFLDMFMVKRELSFNTGDTTSGVKNSGLILHVIESAIGYSFYPSYLGMIIYIISAGSNNAKPKIVNVEGVMCAKKPFLNKIKELIMDCD